MLTDPMVDRLVKQRDSALSQMEAIKQSAIDGDRDLSATDLEGLETYKTKIRECDKQLEIVGDSLAMDDDARSRLALIAPGGQASQPRYRNAGEVVYDLLHQSEPDSRARYGSALKRAAEHMGTDKAITTAEAGDLLGLAITPVVGPVIVPFQWEMPFMSAIGQSVPIGAGGFARPYIVDAHFADGVGVQALEKAELASGAMEVDSDILKSVLAGGYLNISQQLLRHQAGSLNIIVDQMRRRLGAHMEAIATTEALSTTTTEVVAADAEGAALIQAIYDMSAAVYGTTGALASYILMGPLGWARLGGAADAAGRALLPNLAASNAAGTMDAGSFQINGGVAGLRTIVSPSIDDAEFLVGNSLTCEGYWSPYPVLEAVEPSVMGRQIAVAADVVAHRPTPTANGAVKTATA